RPEDRRTPGQPPRRARERAAAWGSGEGVRLLPGAAPARDPAAVPVSQRPRGPFPLLTPGSIQLRFGPMGTRTSDETPRRSRRAARVSSFTESVIREMTRLADEHGAINLAQGFPDFDAPEEIKEADRKST